MPELPEVETTVVLLKEKVLGRTFVFVWEENEESNLKKTEGKKIKDIKRFGKNMLFFLDGESFLFAHLRMTGHFLFIPNKNKSISEIKKDYKFARYIFFLDDDNILLFSDARRFGRVFLTGKKEAKKVLQKLGPDSLHIKEEHFLDLFKKKKAQ